MERDTPGCSLSPFYTGRDLDLIWSGLVSSNINKVGYSANCFTPSSFSPGNFIFHQRFLLFISEMSQFLSSLYPGQEGTSPDLVIDN